jgi:opacity protein-like surface antigen
LFNPLFSGNVMHTKMKLIALSAMALMACAASAQTVQKKAAAGAAKGEVYVERGLASQGLDGLVYAEAGLSLLSYKIARAGISAKPVMLRAIAGYDYHPNLAAEAMLGLGLRGADGVGLFGASYSVRAGTMLGAYAKPRLRVGGDTEFFARLGVANAGTSVGGYTGTDGGAGLSYGLGFKTMTPWKSFGNRPLSVSADYMTYYSGNGVKFTGFTLGAGMSF